MCCLRALRCGFRLDPTKKPKQIDLSDGVKGIYALEGETLKLYWDKQAKKRGRPTTFPTKPESDPDRFFLLLKREKQ